MPAMVLRRLAAAARARIPKGSLLEAACFMQILSLLKVSRKAIYMIRVDEVELRMFLLKTLLIHCIYVLARHAAAVGSLSTRLFA